MTRRTVTEGGRIPIGSREGISRVQAKRLQRFDEAHARRRGKSVFDWSFRDSLRARDYVGVVQVDDLTVEILPKTDHEGQERRVQRNLLYMLSVAGILRVRSRSLAALEHENVPLLDAFVLAFADSLLDELRRGLDRGYRTLEDNLRVVRGRLLFQEQLHLNSVHKERCYVRYDEFTADTALNRLLKCACSLLIRRVHSSIATLRLREILVLLDDVASSEPAAVDTEVTLTRQNARFEVHRDFSLMVLREESPDLRVGTGTSFSLLFPMYRVFEAFIANLMRHHAHELGIPELRITAQAGGKNLLRDRGGRPYVGLWPDVLGQVKGKTAFVLDTKWKLIGARPSIRGVSSGDVYQMFAYSEQYEAPRTILLYPGTPTAQNQKLNFGVSNRILEIGFVDLARDLRTERRAVVAELSCLVDGPASQGRRMPGESSSVGVAEH